MSSKIDVKKSGNVFVVMFDVASNSPLPIANYEDQPVGGFPLTMNGLHELQSKFPGREFRFVEENRPPQPESKPPKDLDQQIRSIMRESGEKMSSPSAAGVVAKAAVVSGSGELDKALSVYKLYLAQYQVADDARKEKLLTTMNACSSLIQIVWPLSGEKLVEIKREVELMNVG